jgi:hypothetical protein
MLSSQDELNFSPYAELYDKIIPKDNLLRRINENTDFSFILEELKAEYCPDKGRTAEPPVRLFKYLCRCHRALTIRHVLQILSRTES